MNKSIEGNKNWQNNYEVVDKQLNEISKNHNIIKSQTYEGNRIYFI